jgi:neutral ceramidase
MTDLFYGSARINITPQYPIAMGGFGLRAQKESIGVHDPLFAKSLFISQNDQSILWITADLVCIPTSLARRVEQALEKEGLEPKEICLCASHTHSGPEVMEYFIQTEAVKEYSEFLVQAFTEVGKAALRHTRPASLKIGTGSVDFLRNRRTRGHPNIVDPRVFALLIEDASSLKARIALFGVGAHPVTLGHENFLISADFPGYAQKLLEEKLGLENALFFNMAEGNVIPNTRQLYDSLDTRGYIGGTFQDAERIGTALADEVLQILDSAKHSVNPRLAAWRAVPEVHPSRFDLDIAVARHQLKVSQTIIAEYLGDDFLKFTPQDLSTLSTLWADASNTVIDRLMPENEMRRLMSAVCNYFVLLERLFNPAQQKPIPLPVQVIQLDDYRFLALPGEVLVEVSLEWQQRNDDIPDNAFVISLANGYMGYLPHRKNFLEPDAPFKYETLMNALEPRAMEIAVEEACQLIKEN